MCIRDSSGSYWVGKLILDKSLIRPFVTLTVPTVPELITHIWRKHIWTVSHLVIFSFSHIVQCPTVLRRILSSFPTTVSPACFPAIVQHTFEMALRGEWQGKKVEAAATEMIRSINLAHIRNCTTCTPHTAKQRRELAALQSKRWTNCCKQAEGPNLSTLWSGWSAFHGRLLSTWQNIALNEI